MVKITGHIRIPNGIIKVKPNKPFFGSNGLELFFIQDEWLSIELAPTPLGCYYLVAFTSDPSDNSFIPTEKWRVPEQDSTLAEVRGIEGLSRYKMQEIIDSKIKSYSELQQQTTKTLAEYEKTLQQRSHLHQEESGKYQTEIQQLKDTLQQRSHLHQEESGKYQTELQQLKDTLQQRSHLHQEESARYQTEIQQLKDMLEQRSHLHQEESGKYQTEIQQLKDMLEQRSHLHQEESFRYQTEIQQLKDTLEQRSHLHQEESGKYQTEIQQLKDTLQHRSHLHQEESVRYQTEIQSLQEALEQSETKELDVTPSNAKATLLRAFNQIQIEDRVLPTQSSNPIKDKTDIARLESIISLLRQNVANKTSQISELESRLNEVFSQLQSYQQRSHIHQEESVKYQTEIQQLKDTLQQRSHIHQEESVRYQSEIQSLQDMLQQSETKELDVTPSNAKATLLRAFNQIQIEDRVLPAQSSNPVKDKTDIARLESIISLLRQNVANKTNQISELESRLNEVFAQLQSYQQRSHIHQEESVKYQTEIQQLKQAQNLDILNRPIDTTKPSDQATKHELIRLFNPH